MIMVLDYTSTAVWHIFGDMFGNWWGIGKWLTLGFSGIGSFITMLTGPISKWIMRSF